MIVKLDSTLKELLINGEIGIRTYNGLTYAGYITLRDIKEDNPDMVGLLRLRNFGKKCYYEITKVFELIPNISSEIANNKDFCEDFYIRYHNLEIYSSIEKIIKDSYLKQPQFFQEEYPNAVSVFNKIISDPKIFLCVNLKFDFHGNIAIRKSIIQYLQSIIDSLIDIDSKDKDIILRPTLNALKFIEYHVDYFSIIDKYQYFMSNEQKELFEIEYKQILQTVSIRTSNNINQYLPNLAIISFIENPYVSFTRENIPNIFVRKSRTNVEFIQLCSQLKTKFNEIFDLDRSTFALFSLKKQYPFLDNSQRNFIIEYEQRHGHLPYFFILYNYLRINSNEDRNIRMFCMHYGISGEPISLKAIAKQEKLTVERVRQIVSKGIKLSSKIIQIDLSNYEQIVGKSYFFPDDSSFIEIINREWLNCSFRAFSALLRPYTNFEFVSFNNLEIIKNKDLFKRIPIHSIIEQITNIAKERKVEDKTFTFSYFYPKINENERALLTAIINYLAISNICVFEDKLIFKQTYIDTKLEIIKILENHGEPMFLDEIFEQFKRKYPELNYTLANHLRSSMKPPIKTIGKQSRYGIETWDNIFWGSIRDLLIKCLVNSESPLHINDLLKEVLIHYPNTNIKNISSTMSSDEFERFVQFEGGYYGLVEKKYPLSYVKSSIIPRYKFEERLLMFKDFVNTYHRFPFSNGGEIEASLHRWYYNISNNVLDITEEQLCLFKNMIFDCEVGYIPRNSYEIEFLNNCNDYKDFVNRNHILPNRKNGVELYNWLNRSKANFNSYTDFRRKYLIDLLSEVASYGFEI